MAELGQDRPPAPKRFYETVSLDADSDGFALKLDGRAAKTRARAPFVMPTAALSDAIAQEWRACGPQIRFDAMPLTRLRMTVIDRAAAERETWRRIILDYLQSDLLVYRAVEPEALVRRQADAWDPVLSDLARACGFTLTVTAGIVHVAQPPAVALRAGAIVEAYTDDTLISVKEMTELLGSAALAIAVEQGLLTPDAAFEKSRIDEEFQIERWGRDAEADANLARRRDAFTATCTYLGAARS